MIFFGWGSKRKDLPIDPKTHVIVTRSFFHIFFVFTVAWHRRFLLAQLGEGGWGVQQISEGQAAHLCGGEAPDIHPWWRFSLVGWFGLGVAVAIISSLF
jgi:hypothetical protein